MLATCFMFFITMVVAGYLGYMISNKLREFMLAGKAPTHKNFELSLNEIYDVIDAVSEEIITNKYEIYYKLKEIKVIPKMDDEIKKITTDILNAFSPTFKESVSDYYSERYFIEMISRRAQAFAIKYTSENKPKSK